MCVPSLKAWVGTCLLLVALIVAQQIEQAVQTPANLDKKYLNGM